MNAYNDYQKGLIKSGTKVRLYSTSDKNQVESESRWLTIDKILKNDSEYNLFEFNVLEKNWENETMYSNEIVEVLYEETSNPEKDNFRNFISKNKKTERPSLDDAVTSIPVEEKEHYVTVTSRVEKFMKKYLSQKQSDETIEYVKNTLNKYDSANPSKEILADCIFRLSNKLDILIGTSKRTDENA